MKPPIQRLHRLLTDRRKCAMFDERVNALIDSNEGRLLSLRACICVSLVYHFLTSIQDSSSGLTGLEMPRNSTQPLFRMDRTRKYFTSMRNSLKAPADAWRRKPRTGKRASSSDDYPRVTMIMDPLSQNQRRHAVAARQRQRERIRPSIPTFTIVLE